MSITLTYRNKRKDIDLTQLQDYQLQNIEAWLQRQANKIRYVIYYQHPIPITAMIRLQQRLSNLLGNLDMITNYKACLN